MNALLLTLFPDMFPGPLGHSLAGKALEKGVWQLDTLNIRDFAIDKHKTVDDSPYGGGTGMVMRPDVLGNTIEEAKKRLPGAQLIYMTPRGTPLTQEISNTLKNRDLIVLCGRYEGVDQRVLDSYTPMEISVGDYILSGGEIAALVLLDACVRLLPGVISKESALDEESFNQNSDFAGLLEYPHYTRPEVWNEVYVPSVLRSGNHQAVENWRKEQAKAITKARRPDLWESYLLSQQKQRSTNG